MTAPGAPSPGRHNDLTDVAGVRVGHHQRSTDGWLTGTTVVLLPPGTVGGVDVRGGGPCTRETDALAPGTLVEVVHAICLSGGSVYGLAAASGVTDWLGERGVGLPVGAGEGEVAPIVPAAGLYDLRPGAFDRRPDAGFGRMAAEAAAAAGGEGPVGLGAVGAGTGARAGGLEGGIGCASVVLDGGVTVAALVAVNSAGSPVDAATGELWGAAFLLPGDAGDLGALRRPALRRPDPRPPPPARPANTVLAVVATDAELLQPECTRLAMAAHDGLARAVHPAHGLTDGDVVFAVATRTAPLPSAAPAATLLRGGSARPAALGPVLTAAADTVTRAVVRAVLSAEGSDALPSYRDLYRADYGRRGGEPEAGDPDDGGPGPRADPPRRG
ncbi:MAG: P1 family peptidase [Acidimicrobiales bacterium]